MTTTTFVTRLQSRASRSLHIAARSAHMEPPIVLGSALVPARKRRPRLQLQVVIPREAVGGGQTLSVIGRLGHARL